jgi:hypothetical protein
MRKIVKENISIGITKNKIIKYYKIEIFDRNEYRNSHIYIVSEWYDQEC